MKKTIFKKTIAALTSFIAVSAMALPIASGAVDTPTINDKPAVVVATPANTADVTVKKDIVLFNVDGSKILSPNITYSYEITPANVTTATITTYSPDDLESDGKTPKTDAVPITVTVKKGIIGAITTANDVASTANKVEGAISFGAADDANTNNNTVKHNTNKESEATVTLSNKVSGSMTITVDANKIYDPDYGAEGHTNTQVNGPGVYRYKIEDVTTDATLTASGIERNYHTAAGDNDECIYLDVYTKYNANKNGLVVYGYVLLKDTSGKDNAEITYKKDTSEETIKITGFDTDSENEDNYGEGTVDKADLTSDAYHTYNVEVCKKTVGDLADTQHNFPFKIELTNTHKVTSLDDFYYVITKDGSNLDEVKTNLSAGGAWTLDGNTDSNLQLQNGDKIVITGLPVKTNIKVTETNNTSDTYSVSATNLKQPTGTGTDDIILESGEKTGTSLSVASNGTAEMNSTLELKKTDAGDKIEITNTLKDISVTGLLFSIAPFAFITIAGAALLALFMRNKKDNESESKL